MSKSVSIALVGIGGYGEFYVTALLDNSFDNTCRLVAVIDPSADKSHRINELRLRNIPIYNSLEQFYLFQTADLVVISSPIHLHCDQTCIALDNGSNVLCEKPAACTVQQVTRMISARNRAGKFVAIGYQWAFSNAIQDLKRDICYGLFGVPRRLKVIILWPRGDTYYNRNKWAGRLKSDDGDWILDSPMHNAAAHYLHCMLYVLGTQTDHSVQLLNVQAELYRANKIENFDTVVMRAHTCDDTEILFYATHACQQQEGPIFYYEFDKAIINYDPKYGYLISKFKDGATKNYGNPCADELNKLRCAIKATQGDAIIPCGLEAAAPQVLCVNGAQDSMPHIGDFPSEMIQVTSGDQTRSPQHYVLQIEHTLGLCFEQNLLPSEINVSWSKPGKVIQLKEYQRFPSWLP